MERVYSRPPSSAEPLLSRRQRYPGSGRYTGRPRFPGGTFLDHLPFPRQPIIVETYIAQARREVVDRVWCIAGFGRHRYQLASLRPSFERERQSEATAVRPSAAWKQPENLWAMEELAHGATERVMVHDNVSRPYGYKNFVVSARILLSADTWIAGVLAVSTFFHYTTNGAFRDIMLCRVDTEREPRRC